MIPESLKIEGGWEDNDWFYICGLSIAIENVHKRYIVTQTDDKPFHLEHTFAYELYYKWKMVLRRRGGNPQRLLLNGELTKHYCKTSCYRFPDIVLHKHYNNYDYQCIICEIKSSRNRILTKNLIKDIESLYGGIIDLKYKCGFFIYIGNKTSDMISRLRKIIKELGYTDSKKIIFVGLNGIDYNYVIL